MANQVLSLALLLCALTEVLGAAPIKYPGTVYLNPCTKPLSSSRRLWLGDLCPSYQAGVEDPIAGAAYGMFEDGEYAKADGGTGWGVLYLNTNELRLYDDKASMYAAGYLEGALTAQQIWDNLDNFEAEYFNNEPVPTNISNFATQQLNWLREMIQKNEGDAYWSEVALVMSQFNGVLDGYNANIPNGAEAITDLDLMLMNMDGDLLDVMPALSFPLTFSQALEFNDHCSSLIRIIGNNTDLLAGHDTWSSYMSMLRIYKHYNLPLQRDATESKGRRISFSSYPGFLSSVDDWYITNHGLIVTETTNDIYNSSLFKLIKPTGMIMSWVRAIVANGLARTGPEWVKIFSNYNSGTYNNQWIIVDLKLFTPGKALPDNLLTIAEQIPGYIHSADLTVALRQQGYWPSYNVPYFPDIYATMGYASMEKKHGNSYSYDKCPRALIFKRDAPKVVDYASFQKLMRYNDYKNDPYSNGNPSNSIMARSDLATHGDPGGAIDSKTTTYKRAIDRMSCDAMNGPTHDQQPAFSWEGKWSGYTHDGQPDLFDFDPIEVAPDMHEPKPFLPIRS